MAYDIASNQILSQPVSGFLQGRALRQAERENDQTMELRGKREARDAESFQINKDDRQAQLDEVSAKRSLAGAQQVLAAPKGQRKKFAEKNFPDFVKQHPEWQQYDETDVEEMAQGVAAQSAAHLGISPQRVETIGDTKNPAAGILQRDPTTGELKQIVAPQQQDHFKEAEAGRDARAKARLDASNKPADQDAVEIAAKAISGYQQAPLGSFAMRTPYGQQVMARVMELNPDYQANEFGSRSKAYKEFTTGKAGNSVRSFNVSISHLGSLQKAADALGNGDVPAFNKMAIAVSRETGGPAPTNFDAMKKIVTDEIVKAIVGTGGGVADREEAAKTIAASNSPAQLSGVVESYKELMAGQLSGLQQQYEQSTGRNDFSRFLSEGSIKYLDAHIGDQQSNNRPQQAPPAALQYLKAHPEVKGAFVQKYGYDPDAR